MPNTNYLQDMKCPECGSEGPFKIAAKCWATVNDDGVEEAEEYDWESTSVCYCPKCKSRSIRFVRDFYTKT